MKRTSIKFVLLMSCAFLTSSCDVVDSYKKLDPIDRDASLQRDDFKQMRDINTVKKPDSAANLSNIVEPPIPDLAEILAAPSKPKIGETQLVSLAVTDDVPLKDVLLEVARLAKIDIDVDAGITGGVSLRATDRPFNEVIDRISDMAGLRYSMKNGVLRVERDTPYIKMYSLDLLNSERSSNGSISIGGGSGSSSSSSSAAGTAGGAATSGGGAASGSSASITAKADSDFWKKFSESIEQILKYKPARLASSSAVSVQPPSAKPLTPLSPALDSAVGGGAAMKPMQAVGFEPESSMPGVAPGGGVGVGTSGSLNTEGAFYVVNRQASTLTVSGTEKQHEMIKNFLDKIIANTSSQVLIEAKVVEVNLSDSYQSGINWTKFGTDNINLSGDLSKDVSSATEIGNPIITVMHNGIFGSKTDLSAAVNLLEEFGTTRALSSPRLNAMNNQQAVLSFVEGIPSFDIKIETTDPVYDSNGRVTTPAKVSVTSTPRISQVGIVLNLQPSINAENKDVTLSIRPTITRLVKLVPDPGFEVAKATGIATVGASTDAGKALAATHSEQPQIETRELDSIVKVKSGQTLVIGGLLEDKIVNTDAGVPYAAEVPILGNLFKAVDKRNTKKELVIFIRATIIGSSGSSDSYDKAVYEKFIQDPRPLKF